MKKTSLISPLLLAASANPFLLPVVQTNSFSKPGAAIADNLDGSKKESDIANPKKWGILDDSDKNRTKPANDDATNAFSPDNYICEGGVCRLKDDNVDTKETNASPLFAEPKSSLFAERYAQEKTDVEKGR